MKKLDQDQEAQRAPYRRNMLRHTLIKLTEIKHKERILKAAKEKQQVIYKGIPIRIIVDLSAETLKARREWQDIFKMMNMKNLQPRLLLMLKDLFTPQIRNIAKKQT